MTNVTHLECSLTGERYEADRLHGLSRAGRPLLVRYDLDGVRRALPRPGVTLTHDLHHFVPISFEARAARGELVSDPGAIHDVQDLRDGGRKVLAAPERHDREFGQHVVPPCSFPLQSPCYG